MIDLRDPGAPILVEKVLLEAHGAGLNSVDAHDGLVAVAVVDVPTATVTTIAPLGLKDHSIPGHGLDASDKDDAINIATRERLFGLYQPEAIASFRVEQHQLLVTANEGDSRSGDDFEGFNEEVRLSSSGYVLDPGTLPSAGDLKKSAALGRLNVTTESGDADGDGDFGQIHVFGTRSFSIWTTSGELAWDRPARSRTGRERLLRT